MGLINLHRWSLLGGKVGSRCGCSELPVTQCSILSVLQIGAILWTHTMVWEPELCSEKPAFQKRKTFNKYLMIPSGSFNIATGCAPAVIFYLVSLWRGAWEVQPLGWTSKEQDLPCHHEMGVTFATFAHGTSYPSLQCLKWSLQKTDTITSVELGSAEHWRWAQQSPRLGTHAPKENLLIWDPLPLKRGDTRHTP